MRFKDKVVFCALALPVLAATVTIPWTREGAAEYTPRYTYTLTLQLRRNTLNTIFPSSPFYVQLGDVLRFNCSPILTENESDIVFLVSFRMHAELRMHQRIFLPGTVYPCVRTAWYICSYCSFHPCSETIKDLQLFFSSAATLPR